MVDAVTIFMPHSCSCIHYQARYHMATNLAECILGWRGVVPTSLPLRNTIKGVACAQTFVHLGMQLKDAVYKNLCSLSLSFLVL